MADTSMNNAFRNVVFIRYKELTSLEPLKQGGYGIIYKATHTELKTVAYKELLRCDRGDGDLLINEAAIQGAINHANIVKVFGIVYEPKHRGIVLEYMSHGDLNEYLQNNDVDWTTKRRLLADVAAGMECLHEHNPPIIHGDLKTQNVLIGDDLKAKVCDFGFSRWKDYSQSTSCERTRLGTVTHIPPENWKNPNYRKMEPFDVYGFGIMMWEVMTQQKPFAHTSRDVICVYVMKGDRPDLDLIPDTVSRRSCDLMQTCWSQNATDRPSFTVVRNTLERETLKLDAEVVAQFVVVSIVLGITRIQNNIYVLCEKHERILVFDTELPHDRLESEEIEITGIQYPEDMVACPSNQTIFISDKMNKCIWKIQHPVKELVQCVTGIQPHTMSVTNTSELLVIIMGREMICRWYLDIFDCTTFARSARITFRDEIKRPKHAIRNSKRNFIVLYHVETTALQENKAGRDFLVSEMTDNGQILRTFAVNSYEISDHCRELPCYRSYLGMDENDDIFIADYFNHQIILLNSNMTESRIIRKGDEDISTFQSVRLCYLQDKRMLIVGNLSPPSVSIHRLK